MVLLTRYFYSSQNILLVQGHFGCTTIWCTSCFWLWCILTYLSLAVCFGLLAWYIQCDIVPWVLHMHQLRCNATLTLVTFLQFMICTLLLLKINKSTIYHSMWGGPSIICLAAKPIWSLLLLLLPKASTTSPTWAVNAVSSCFKIAEGSWMVSGKILQMHCLQ